ncbi:unnamed protein product [Echinostoma caproni]|uniref:NYD-SP28_assoc domain-containing protein n=1 Tax=Echinostoma caproni TaxID=27848 RepID=A0A183AW27_9TREM|nr:unnamed protein product [Echinostoma caproni]
MLISLRFEDFDSLGVTNEEELDLLFTFFIMRTDATQGKEKPPRTARTIRLVEPHGPIQPEPEESVESETQVVITPSQPVDSENHVQTEEDKESDLTSTDEAVATDVPTDEPKDIPLLHSEPMGPVKRTSMGVTRTNDYGTEILDSVKQQMWSTETHKDPEIKHTSLSDMTELTLMAAEEELMVSKCWSLIAPVNVVNALHQFTMEMQRLSSRCPGTNRSRPEAPSELEQSKNLRSQVVTEETEQIWDHLSIALERYLSILKHRAQVIRESEALRRQNEELRHLLQQYLSAKVNYELQVPPARTLQLN